jgi:hypothetical protein
MNNILWCIFIYPFICFKIFLLKIKNKRMSQQNRLHIYKQYPPIEGDVGIGYRNGKLYDYIYKGYMK